MTRRFWLMSLLAVMVWISAEIAGQDRSGAGRTPSTANGDWPHYTADMRGTKY